MGRRAVFALGAVLALALTWALWRGGERESATLPALGPTTSAQASDEALVEPQPGADRVQTPSVAAAAPSGAPPQPLTITPDGNGKFSIRYQQPRGDPRPLEVFALDAVSEAPVAGATVSTLDTWKDGTVIDEKTTDGAGRAVVSALPEGASVRVVAEGYAAWSASGELGDPPKPIHARLLRPATLHGKVTGAAGEALFGIAVRLVDRNDTLQAPAAMSAIDGSYRLEVAPDVSFLVELADGNGAVLQRDSREWSLASGESLELDFRIGTRASVRGRALDSSGVPVAGLNVCLVRGSAEGPRYLMEPPSDSDVQAEQLTAIDGTFEFAEVPAGRYLLGPRPPQRAKDPRESAVALRFEGVVVDGAYGDVERDLVVWRDLWITGVVRHEDGTPAGNAWVGGYWKGVVGNALVRTDADGAFRLGPLPAGPAELYARGPRGSLDQRVESEAGAQGVVLVLRESGFVQVEVKPPGKGWVSFFDMAEDGSILTTQASSESVALAPGSYQVLVQTYDGRIGRARDVQILAGETVRATVDVEPGATLRLRCDAASNDATVRIWGGDDLVDVLRRLDARSAPAVVVPAGRQVRVTTSGADGSVQEYTLLLSSGDVRELDVCAPR